MLVLGSHYFGFANLAWHIPEFGWIGVDIFFALSGYLITTILLGSCGRDKPYKTFYSRRMVRILPPYLATTLLLLLIGFRQHWQIPQFLVSQIFFLQALPQVGRSFCVQMFHHPWYHLSHPAPLLRNAHSLPLASIGLPPQYLFDSVPYWSLSVEEYFYLLWAPIVLTCSRTTVVRITAFVCVAEIMLRWVMGDFFAYLFLPCRFDSLLYGALLAILFAHWNKNGMPRRATAIFVSVVIGACVGIALILYAIHPILGREIRYSPLCLVFGLPILSIGVTALIAILLIHANSGLWLARILRTKTLVFIGTISYTMYLVHALVDSAVLGALRRCHWNWSGTVEAVTSLLLTILIAYASWHWLEKPLLRWKDRRFPNMPHPSEPVLN